MMKKYFLFLFVALFFINLINAIGVASLYSGSELPLEMHPGEEKTVMLELQNWDINEEIVLEGKILQGDEIAFLKESSIKVPYQVKTPVEMAVKIPKNASAGDKYNIEYEFRQASGKGEGMVSFGQGIIRNFDVIIIKEIELKEEKISVWWIGLIIILLIVIIIVIWFIVRRRQAS